jgi:hypothetical protein
MKQLDLQRGVSVSFRAGKLSPTGITWLTDPTKNFITDFGMSMLAYEHFTNMTRNIFLGTGDTQAVINISLSSLSPITGVAVSPTSVFVSGHVGKQLLLNNGYSATITGLISGYIAQISTENVPSSYVGYACIVLEDIDQLEEPVLASGNCDIDPAASYNDRVVDNTNNTVTYSHTRSIVFGAVDANIIFKEIGWSNSILNGNTTKLFGRKVIELPYEAGDIPYIRVTVSRTFSGAEVVHTTPVITGTVASTSRMLVDHPTFNSKYISTIGPDGETIAPQVGDSIMEGYNFGSGNMQLIVSDTAADQDSLHPYGVKALQSLSLGSGNIAMFNVTNKAGYIMIFNTTHLYFYNTTNDLIVSSGTISFTAYGTIHKVVVDNNYIYMATSLGVVYALLNPTTLTLSWLQFNALGNITDLAVSPNRTILLVNNSTTKQIRMFNVSSANVLTLKTVVYNTFAEAGYTFKCLAYINTNLFAIGYTSGLLEMLTVNLDANTIVKTATHQGSQFTTIAYIVASDVVAPTPLFMVGVVDNTVESNHVLYLLTATYVSNNVFVIKSRHCGTYAVAGFPLPITEIFTYLGNGTYLNKASGDIYFHNAPVHNFELGNIVPPCRLVLPMTNRFLMFPLGTSAIATLYKYLPQISKVVNFNKPCEAISTFSTTVITRVTNVGSNLICGWSNTEKKYYLFVNSNGLLIPIPGLVLGMPAPMTGSPTVNTVYGMADHGTQFLIANEGSRLAAYNVSGYTCVLAAQTPLTAVNGAFAKLHNGNYAVGRNSNIAIYSFNGTAFSQVASYDLPNYEISVAITHQSTEDDTVFYVASHNKLYKLRQSVGNVELLGSLELETDEGTEYIDSLEVVDNIAYITRDYSSLSIVDVSTDVPKLLRLYTNYGDGLQLIGKTEHGVVITDAPNGTRQIYWNNDRVVSGQSLDTNKLNVHGGRQFILLTNHVGLCIFVDADNSSRSMLYSYDISGVVGNSIVRKAYVDFYNGSVSNMRSISVYNTDTAERKIMWTNTFNSSVPVNNMQLSNVKFTLSWHRVLGP